MCVLLTKLFSNQDFKDIYIYILYFVMKFDQITGFQRRKQLQTLQKEEVTE